MRVRTLVFTVVTIMALGAPIAALDTAFSYQGRLNDAGSPADGDYDFQFILFSSEVGGSQVGPILNGDDVQVIDGYFTVYLDFGAGVFDGTALWLEVQVRDGGSMGAYTPLAPRQAVLPSPYSLYSGKVEWDDIEGMPPGFADGTDDGTAYQAGNQLDLASDTFNVVEGAGSGLDADTVDGQEAVDFATTTHGHAGEDITSGTVAVARIHSSVARDSEIMPTVLDADGAGSTLDADTVDGQQAAAFAASSHTHSGAHITTGTVVEPRIDAAIARDSEIMPRVLANDGSGSGLDADTVDGESASDFANSSHSHSGSHITTGTVADGRIAPTLARDAEVMPIVLASDGPSSGLDADTLDGHGSGSFSPAAHSHFSAGDGLEFDGLILNVDPTDFNGSSPIGVSSQGSATSTTSTWVLVDSISMTAPADGEVLIVWTGNFGCRAGCNTSTTGWGSIGFGVNDVPSSAETTVGFAGAGTLLFDHSNKEIVSEGLEYQFRVYVRRPAGDGVTIIAEAKLWYVFIPD